MEQEDFIIAVNLGDRMWVYLRSNLLCVKRWTQETQLARGFQSKFDANAWADRHLRSRDYDLYLRTLTTRKIGQKRIKAAWQNCCGAGMPGCAGGDNCKSDHK